MKFLFDEDLSPRLVALGEDYWAGSAQIDSLGMRGASDAEIWAFARERGFTIVSKDDDFRSLALVRGPPPKVVWIQAGNASTARIAEILLSRLLELEAFHQDPVEALLVFRAMSG